MVAVLNKDGTYRYVSNRLTIPHRRKLPETILNNVWGGHPYELKRKNMSPRMKKQMAKEQKKLDKLHHGGNVKFV
jgi:hypothetical protein